MDDLVFCNENRRTLWRIYKKRIPAPFRTLVWYEASQSRLMYALRPFWSPVCRPVSEFRPLELLQARDEWLGIDLNGTWFDRLPECIMDCIWAIALDSDEGLVRWSDITFALPEGWSY